MNATHTKILLAVSVLITPATALAEITQSKPAINPPATTHKITQSKPAINPPATTHMVRGGGQDGNPFAIQQGTAGALEKLEREYEREKAKLEAQLDGLKTWYERTKASLEESMEEGDGSNGEGDNDDEHLFPTNPGQPAITRLGGASEASENERKRARSIIRKARRAMSGGASSSSGGANSSDSNAQQPSKKRGQDRIQPVVRGPEVRVSPSSGRDAENDTPPEDDASSDNGSARIDPGFDADGSRERAAQRGGRSVGGGGGSFGRVSPGRRGVPAPTPPAVNIPEGRIRNAMPDLPNLNPRLSNERQRGSASIRDVTDEESAEIDQRIAERDALENLWLGGAGNRANGLSTNFSINTNSGSSSGGGGGGGGGSARIRDLFPGTEIKSD